MPRGSGYWTHRVFVDSDSPYAEVLEVMKPAALPQVLGVHRLLDAHGIPRNGRVLDIACGIGRHIVPLAKIGYRAVGCDFSPRFIEKARAWARRAHLDSQRIRFYVTDYRRIDRTLRAAGEKPFDAAVCIFTSLGHYGEKGDLAVLRAVRRVIRPGGLFVLEMGSRDWVLRHYAKTGVVRYGRDLELRERRRFDWERSAVISQWTFFRGRGRRRRKIFEQETIVRLYSLHELRSLLERAGWEYLRSYGDLAKLSPHTFDSRRLVAVARSKGAGSGTRTRAREELARP